MSELSIKMDPLEHEQFLKNFLCKVYKKNCLGSWTDVVKEQTANPDLKMGCIVRR